MTERITTEAGRPPLDPLTKAHDDGWMEGYKQGKAEAVAAYLASPEFVERLAVAIHDTSLTSHSTPKGHGKFRPRCVCDMDAAAIARALGDDFLYDDMDGIAVADEASDPGERR